jgi:hypothetical protein
LRSERLDADVDDVVGGEVGGRLKVTCRGRPRCDGGGERTGGACAPGVPCAAAWLVLCLPVSWLL